MSFIKNNHQLSVLLAGLGASDVMKRDPFLKEGQATPIDKLPIQTILELATPYIKSLQEQIDPTSPRAAVSPLSSESSEFKDPIVSDFRSLGDYIQWAANNKITWQNARFAWKSGEQPANAEPYTSYTYERERGKEREALKADYYVAPAQLEKSLEYLRDVESKRNKVLEVMIGSLINEYNRDFSKDLASKPKPSLIDESLSSDDIVDVFPSNLLDLSKWDEGLGDAPFLNKGTYRLTIGDLSSLSNLKNWLTTMKVRVKDEKGTPRDLEALSEDPCVAVHILYKRATKLVDSGERFDIFKANFSKMASSYLSAIKSLGSQITNKEGKPCEVTQPRAAGETADRAGAGAGAAGRPGAARQEKADYVDTSAMGGVSKSERENVFRLMSEMSQYLPLSPNEVNFGRINQFFIQLEKIMPEVKQIYAQVQDSMQRANANLRPGFQNLFVLNITPEQLKNNLENPALVSTFTGFVSDVVAGTQRALIAFRSKFHPPPYRNTILMRYPELLHDINIQAGQNESDMSCIAARNINKIDLLGAMAQQSIKATSYR